jgi:hypothetical protein
MITIVTRMKNTNPRENTTAFVQVHSKSRTMGSSWLRRWPSFARMPFGFSDGGFDCGSLIRDQSRLGPGDYSFARCANAAEGAGRSGL